MPITRSVLHHEMVRSLQHTKSSASLHNFFFWRGVSSTRTQPTSSCSTFPPLPRFHNTQCRLTCHKLFSIVLTFFRWVFVFVQWVFVLDHRVFVLDQWVFVLDQWVFVLDHRVFGFRSVDLRFRSQGLCFSSVGLRLRSVGFRFG